jgi:hypothetical protein
MLAVGDRMNREVSTTTPSEGMAASRHQLRVPRYRRSTERHLVADDRGAEQLEVVAILAGVVVPMTIAARLMWRVLLYYFSVETFVIDLPF